MEMKSNNRMMDKIRLLVLSLLMLAGCAVASAQSSDEDYGALADLDREMLQNAVRMVDDGLNDAAQHDLDLLVKKYPDNYLVRYEQLYNFYMMKKYDEVVRHRKFMLRNKHASPLTFQLIGNAYDYMGKREEAAKVYQQGLERFPDSGSLYLECGTLCFMAKEYDKALALYNKGIEVEPNFASNYYRSSVLYFSAQNGVPWGEVYAESAILLAPNNDERHRELADMMVSALRDNITYTRGDSTVLKVSLATARNLKIDADNNVYIEFPGLYEGLMTKALSDNLRKTDSLTFDFPQLIDIRRSMVDSYCNIADTLYGNSMYLFEFQKKVIDAGHWEAYNYYIFMNTDEEQWTRWYQWQGGEEKIKAFVDWYNEEPFRLGDGRSVCERQIYDSYPRVDMMKSMTIQAGLLDAKYDDEGTSSPKE